MSIVPDDSDQALKTVGRFRTTGEAEVARNRLEAEGIPALVLGQDQLRFSLLRPAEKRGVRLQVRSEHLEDAQAILGLTDGQQEPVDG